MSEKRLGTSSNPGWREYDLLAAEGKRLAEEARERKKREAARARREATALKKKQADQKAPDQGESVRVAPALASAMNKPWTDGLEDPSPSFDEVDSLPKKITGSKTSMIFGPGVDKEANRVREAHGPNNKVRKSTIRLPGYNSKGEYVSRADGRADTHRSREGERRIGSIDNAKPRSQDVRRGPSIRDMEELAPKQRKERFTSALAEIQEEQERETREAALRKQIDALKAEGHDLSSDVEGLTKNTTMNPEQAMEIALVMHKGRQGQPEREALEAERAAHKARRDYKKGLRKPSPETRVDEEQALEAELAELETLGEGGERKTPWNRLRDGLNALFS